MLVNEFNETCQLYTNFEIWEIENMEAFFKGNDILDTIFKDLYNMSSKEIGVRKEEIKDSFLDVILNVLHLVDDKSFYVFTLHDKKHLELVKMQQLKIMNFGLDISKIKSDCVYTVIMDKRLE